MTAVLLLAFPMSGPSFKDMIFQPVEATAAGIDGARHRVHDGRARLLLDVRA
jgi:hypothetical protein